MKDSETFLKNVYNTHAPHYNTIRNWFHRFEKDDFSLDEKDRSGRPRESPQDVPKPDLHPKKVMLSVWWGVDGPIYWELLPEGKTITGDLYTTQLRNLKKAVDRSALKDKKVYYQHDNARPHVSKQVKQELMGYGWNVLPHPPYSPDLASFRLLVIWRYDTCLRRKKLQFPWSGRSGTQTILCLTPGWILPQWNP
ncbi:unnamed protein product [Caenorhabditis nigoni]